MRSTVAKIIKVIAVIIWVLGLIIGIVMGATGTGGYYDSPFNAWMMLLYWLMFFIIGIFYYAFGELVGNVAGLRVDTVEWMERMSETMDRMAALMAASAAQAQPAPAMPQPMSGPQPQQSEPYASSGRAPADIAYRKSELLHPTPDYIICPYCNAHQLANRSVCWKCGVKFID